MVTLTNQDHGRLNQLIAEQQRINAEIACLLARCSGVTDGVLPRSHTAAARVRQLLRREPTRIWTLTELKNALSDVSPQTVRATIGRLCRESDGAEAVSDGRYRFVGS